MTQTEVSKLVAVLAAHYPTAKLSRDNLMAYERALADLDYQLAQSAVERIVRTSRFFPSIAEIREACTLKTTGPTRTGVEAYAELMLAVRRHGRTYGEEEAPKFKDPIIAKCLGIWGSWNSLCNSPTDDAAGRARFVELYDSLAKSQRQDVVAGRALSAQGNVVEINRLIAGIGVADAKR